MKGVSVCSRAPTSSVYLCVYVCVLVGIVEKAMGEDTQWELVLHGFSKLTCWFLLGLWWSSNRGLKPLMISSLFSVSVYYGWSLLGRFHTGFVYLSLNTSSVDPANPTGLLSHLSTFPDLGVAFAQFFSRQGAGVCPRFHREMSTAHLDVCKKNGDLCTSRQPSERAEKM